MYVVQADIQSYGFDAEAYLPDENDETDGVIVVSFRRRRSNYF